MKLFLEIIFYLISYVSIWFGSGLIVSSVEGLSQKLKISTFAASFFVLGMLTSIPELSVGINSLIDQTPQIFAGNLIGASVVLFTLVIPILAVFGNGIHLAHQLDGHNLIVSLLVIVAPSVMILDKRLTTIDGILLLILYGILFYMIEKKRGVLEYAKDKLILRRTHIIIDVSKMASGSILVFVSSKLIVDMSIYFASRLNISPYYIGLVFLSFGTNLPELTLALRSLAAKKKEIALGDYIGSSAANTFIFGFLVLLHGKPIFLPNHLFSTFLLFSGSLVLFYFFIRSKSDFSRKEGIILLATYGVFIALQYWGL